jgi:hypothetical protein
MVGTLVAFELDDPKGAGDGWLQGVATRLWTR